VQLLTLKEIEEILHAHETAEEANDLEGTMATVVVDPHYELPVMGVKLDGRQAVREFYRRTLPRMTQRDVHATMRVHGLAANTLLREAYVHLEIDGQMITGNYCAVLLVDPEQRLIAGERVYMDPWFTKILLEDLGPDFEQVPGVSRMEWAAYAGV
jgi:hypothetical protein